MSKPKEANERNSEHSDELRPKRANQASADHHPSTQPTPASNQARRNPTWLVFCRVLATFSLILMLVDNYKPIELVLGWSPGLAGRQPVKPYEMYPAEEVPDTIDRPAWAQTPPPENLQELLWSKTPAKHDEAGIDAMRTAGKIASKALAVASAIAKPGVTTDFIDRAVHRYIISERAYPSPLLFKGYPRSVCTSVNEVMVHGVPDGRPLEDGDIVNVDVSLYYQGHHADTSATFMIGNASSPAGRKVVSAARQALQAAVAACGPGKTLAQMGEAVQRVADATGCGTVKNFIGHGIGKFFHGAPRVYSFAPRGWLDLVVHYKTASWNKEHHAPLQPGATFTIEPILVEPGGSIRTKVWQDKWTAASVDGSLNAQFEYTVLVQEPGEGEGEGGCEILTPFAWDTQESDSQGLKADAGADDEVPTSSAQAGHVEL